MAVFDLENRVGTDELVKILTVLQGEDELRLIIRAHILIENQIEGFLQERLPAPDELAGISYSNKIRVALACGLCKSLKKSLAAVGYLRNDFAHTSDRSITEVDVSKTFKSLRKRDADLIERLYSSTLGKQFFGSKDGMQKQQLSLCLSAIWMGVVMERQDHSVDSAAT